MASPVVLLTGASGLVGTWLRRLAPGGVEVVSLTHRTAVAGTRSVAADLRDRSAVLAAFASVRPDLVIHAAMAVDEASIVDATRNVVEAAEAVGSNVLFVSTDAVFSGNGRPVDEATTPDPIWAYGRWKVQAEEVVLAASLGASAQGAVVRLPLVVSLDPPDAAVTRVRAGSVDAPSVWFDDELRQPALASDIAVATWRIALLDPADRSGIWHLIGAETLSRYEIARRVARALDLPAAAVGGEPTRPGLARPRHLALTSERARAEVGWDPVPILR